MNNLIAYTAYRLHSFHIYLAVCIASHSILVNGWISNKTIQPRITELHVHPADSIQFIFIELFMNQSVPSANIPSGNPRGFAPIFSPGPEDLYHLNCPGVARGSDLLSKYQVVS